MVRVLRVANCPVLSLLALAAALAGGCQSSDPSPDAGAPAAAPAQVTYDDHGTPEGLHEFNPFTERVTSGAQPEGDVAFRNLAALGFRTIVSVDGALPDVTTAKRYGLRYVHVPMQYSGVRPEEAAQLAKAVESSDGPVYIHCHHGKHRSPAATGAACVALGYLTPDQAVAEMKESGTDAKYQGLFRDVAAARQLTPEQLAAVSSNLPESVSPGDLATAMVDVDLRWEHLKASKAAKWGVPPKNPDVDPPHEARMLWEHYREIARLSDAKSHGEKFLKFLADGETSAKSLEAALRAKDAEKSNTAFDAGAKACSGCHKAFRDN